MFPVQVRAQRPFYAFLWAVYVTFSKGELAQLRVQMRALEKGILVSKPVVEARYDLILDDNGKLSRVQVKYAGSFDGGAVEVDLRKETRNNGRKRNYSRAEIDAVIVFIPTISGDLVWLTPDLFSGKNSVNIHIEPCKTTQTKGVRYLSDLRW